MTVSNELIDSLLANYKKPEDLIGEHGILKQLTKRLVERALEVRANALKFCQKQHFRRHFTSKTPLK